MYAPKAHLARAAKYPLRSFVLFRQAALQLGGANLEKKKCSSSIDCKMFMAVWILLCGRNQQIGIAAPCRDCGRETEPHEKGCLIWRTVNDDAVFFRLWSRTQRRRFKGRNTSLSGIEPCKILCLTRLFAASFRRNFNCGNAKSALVFLNPGGLQQIGQWWAHQDLNLGPAGYEPAALPTEL